MKRQKKIAVIAMFILLLANFSVSYVLSASSSASTKRSASVSFYRPASQLFKGSPKTGDFDNWLLILIITCTLCLLTIGVIITLKRKKNKKFYLMILPLFVSFACLFSSMFYFTAVVKAAGIGSGGQVGYLDSGRPPVPTDPNETLREVDPGSGYEIVGINGVYLVMAPKLDFGSHPITDKDISYPVKPIEIKYPDTGETTYLTPYAEVVDERLHGGGWQVTATLAEQLKDQKGNELQGAEIHLRDINYYDNEYKKEHIKTPEVVVLRPGQEQLVITASQEADSYRYYAIFNSVSLNVPGKTNKSEEAYNAEVIWRIYDTP